MKKIIDFFRNLGKRRVQFIGCVSAAAFVLSGCGAISATTLRCGTDGDSSYVEIGSAPQSIAQNTRALAELCGFAYEIED